jgi:hypothetical protein
MTRRGTVWTLATLNTDIGVRLDDAAHTRWTSAQKDVAIKSAVRHARGKWWEERIDSTVTYSQDDYRYDLPVACEVVEAIYFEPTSSDDPRHFAPPTSWHVEGSELVFTSRFSDYDGQTMYLHYLVYPANLLTVTAADGVVATGGLSLTSATATFVTNGVLPGDEIELPADTGGPYYVSSVTSNTVLVPHKAATAGSTLTYHIARYTDLPYEYLIFGAMAELYEMSSRNRPGVEVEESIRWATYYRQMAEVSLKQQARHAKPQRRY